MRILGVLLTLALVGVACGGGDDDSGADGGGGENSDGGTDNGGGSNDDNGSSGGGNGSGGDGLLVFGGEEIALSAGRCFFEEQDVAGSKITATAQASGTNAAGEQVLVDFTRFKESSFSDPGDDITVNIGPLGNSTEYGVFLPLNTVSISDGQVSVGESTFSSFDDGSEVVGSVTIEC